MGRYSWSSRFTVGNCRAINIVKLKEWGFFKGVSGLQIASNYGSGRIKWTNPFGEEIGSIGIKTNINMSRGELYLHYNWVNNSTGENQELNYPVILVPSFCHFGGRRWWFICPLQVNGAYCGKRIGRLYLPPNAKYFGCRHCYNLTYESCRRSHNYSSHIYKICRVLDGTGKHKN